MIIAMLYIRKHWKILISILLLTLLYWEFQLLSIYLSISVFLYLYLSLSLPPLSISPSLPSLCIYVCVGFNLSIWLLQFLMKRLNRWLDRFIHTWIMEDFYYTHTHTHTHTRARTHARARARARTHTHIYIYIYIIIVMSGRYMVVTISVG